MINNLQQLAACSDSDFNSLRDEILAAAANQNSYILNDFSLLSECIPAKTNLYFSNPAPNIWTLTAFPPFQYFGTNNGFSNVNLKHLAGGSTLSFSDFTSLAQFLHDLPFCQDSSAARFNDPPQDNDGIAPDRIISPNNNDNSSRKSFGEIVDNIEKAVTAAVGIYAAICTMKNHDSDSDHLLPFV